MQRMRIAALLLAAFAAGCAQVPLTTRDGVTVPQPAPASSPAQAQYQQGLAKYRDNQADAALNDLALAVGSGQLNAADTNNARKHMAFVHCAAGRELQCREQFQAILSADADFELALAEATDPHWASVWRSIKGAAEEKRALAQASSANATPGQHKLAEGIKEYEDSRYRNALDALQGAIRMGLPSKADEMRAHKYSAFAYCLTRRMKQCRAEFRQMFLKDPVFELLPSETGHPAWAAVYRSEKAASVKKADAAKKTGGRKSPDMAAAEKKK